MTIIKASDELMAKLGAKTPAEFLAAVEQLTSQPEPAAETDDNAVASAFDALNADIANLGSLINALTTKVDTFSANSVTAEHITKLAKSEASRVTAEALAATGTNPAPASVSADNPANSRQIAPDDYKGQWDASEETRAEFGGNFKAFEAYQKGMQAGKIKIYQPKAK